MTTRTASFKRTERLTHPEEFRKALKKGAVVKKDGMALYYLPNELTCSRLGIIVSRKAVRHAIDRNKIKRITRELFRTNKSKFKTSYDLVFRAQYEFNSFVIKDLREINKNLLEQARLFAK
jgi:ribonuclease P protein component